MTRQNKVPSVVPAHAELASGRRCSEAPAAPRAPRLFRRRVRCRAGVSASFGSVGTKTHKASSPTSAPALERNLYPSLGGAGGGPRTAGSPAAAAAA